MRPWGYFDDFSRRRSAPRPARGGIKAHHQRGSFGESWWAKRWIEVLESLQIGARLQRGRSYARRGQVLSIVVEKGLVTARVQGSRPQPYEVSIRVKMLTRMAWSVLAQTLSQQAVFSAKLLAGEMPPEIEQVFQRARLSLFPEKRRDLATNCSCPDWSNPCKHIAAVYYLLAEEFDRDPFLIFKMRGLAREELVELLGQHPAGRRKGAKSGLPAAPASPAPCEASQPLGIDGKTFWTGGTLPEDIFGEVRVPSLPAALPRRLRGFPFWQGAIPLQEALEKMYAAASERGLRLFLGERFLDEGDL